MGRPRLNKPGDQFGEWTLVEPDGKRKWKCQCSCGTIKSVRTDTLTSGTSRCCGCKTKEYQRDAKIKQGPKEDLVGRRYGRLTVLGYAGGSKWHCRCDCGEERIIHTGALNFGVNKSCGCKSRDFIKGMATTHGLSKDPLYIVWQGIKHRCYNPKAKHYKSYGGRGITICEEWLNDFVPFYEWAISTGYRKGLTIDRIDVNGNYCPENCRWATQKEQMNNVRHNRMITHNGETKTARQWADFFGVPYHVFYGRVVGSGWAVEKAITEPVAKRKKRSDLVEQTKNSSA